MMKYFTIGRIDGEWINFIPPIQGGKFELEPEDEGIVIEDSSSEDRLCGFTSIHTKSAVVRNHHNSTDLPAEFDQYPPLTPQVQHQITLKYRELDNRLWQEGYYECYYSRYLPEIARYTTLALISYIALTIPMVLYIRIISWPYVASTRLYSP